ncbi:MAG: hypothetical protein ABIQ16_20795 [Polyangiaceae bacterium]
MNSRRAARTAVALLLTAIAARAHAQLPADGQLIRTNGYGIDLFQGPVLASTRVIGLAGAYVAIGEGIEGDTQNPAAPAMRVPWSNSHLDYDLGFGVTFPSSLKSSDFFNSGRRTDLPKGTTGGFVFLNLAGNVQFGKWGLGATTDLQTYSLNRNTTSNADKLDDQLVATITLTQIQLARAFADGQLILGAGGRIATLAVNKGNSTSQQDLFSTVGNGYEAGFVVRPNDYQFRIGGAFRSGVTTRASRDSESVLYAGDPVNELYLPTRVTVPWDLDLGVAIQLGPRPLNPRWIDPSVELERVKRFLRWRELERDRRRRTELLRVASVHGDVDAAAHALDEEFVLESALDEVTRTRAESDLDAEIRRRLRELRRFHVLLLSSLVISGAVKDAVGVESFLERVAQHSGASLSYSPRFAVETEIAPNWLRLRAGSYHEPSRFPSNQKGGRLHGTLGIDAKLFPFAAFGLVHEGTVWRVSGSLDAARDYFGWSVSIGVWH